MSFPQNVNNTAQGTPKGWPWDPPVPGPQPASTDDSIRSVGGKFFMLDGSGKLIQVDLGTLMMMLTLQRTENLDKQVAMQLSEIQKRNAIVAALTEAMSKLRELKASGAVNTNVTINGPDGKPVSLKDFLGGLGISFTEQSSSRTSQRSDADKRKWDETAEANISNIKGKIDGFNNDSQMANIKLQNVLEKRNNSFEMATKVMQTNNQSMQSVIRNL